MLTLSKLEQTHTENGATTKYKISCTKHGVTHRSTHNGTRRKWRNTKSGSHQTAINSENNTKKRKSWVNHTRGQVPVHLRICALNPKQFRKRTRHQHKVEERTHKWWHVSTTLNNFKNNNQTVITTSMCAITLTTILQRSSRKVLLVVHIQTRENGNETEQRKGQYY